MTEVGKGFCVNGETSAAFLEATRGVSPKATEQVLAALALHGLASGGREINFDATGLPRTEGPITDPATMSEALTPEAKEVE